MKNPKKTLTTETIIKASPEKVWHVLMDFPRYREWNPFIPQIEGEPVPGSTLHVMMVPPGGKAVKMTPRVLKSDSENSFSWLGHLFIPGLFDGEHIFEIHAVDEGQVRFVQMENFKGILVGLFQRMLDTTTKQGFTEMNAALKERCESDSK